MRSLIEIPSSSVARKIQKLLGPYPNLTTQIFNFSVDEKINQDWDFEKNAMKIVCVSKEILEKILAEVHKIESFKIQIDQKNLTILFRKKTILENLREQFGGVFGERKTA